MASQLTKIIANFSTQITSNISVGGLTASLASNLDKEGNILPSGKYCFTINQGKSNEQHFLCDLAGTSITNVQGVDHSGDLSTGFLKEARINDEIKITDYVNLLRIVEILSGEKALDGGTPLKYDTAPALTDPRQIPDKAYTDTALNSKAGVADNNVFTGNNTFQNEIQANGGLQSPLPIKAADPVNSDHLATKAFVLAQAFGGAMITGFNSPEVNFRPDGKIRSIHDVDSGLTFAFVYDAIDKLIAIVDGTNEWAIRYDSQDNIPSIYKH